VGGFTTLLLAALSLGAASSAEAATLTQPTNGETISSMYPAFSWTMGPNEVMPSVQAARAPSYTADAGGGCQAADPEARITSCTSPLPLPDGTWYAYVQTQDNNTGQTYSSPFVRFVVPARVGFGPHGPWGGNPILTGYTPERGLPGSGWDGPIVVISPYSFIQLNGWLNHPGGKVTITYIVKHGRRVVGRSTHSARVGGDEDWTFNDMFFLLHVRGVGTGTRLSCTMILRGDGASAQKTLRLRNPPSGGHWVHHH
jgi:hypothetical protein